MGLTRGQALAIEQLSEIANSSENALNIISDTKFNTEVLHLRLSLATKSYRRKKGFSFRDREILTIYIYPDFPFTAPKLYFSHIRFIGEPHVQWGNSICLYQSIETEWKPSDGLYGFFHRVDEWMTAAGKGELDPHDAPLHPPVTYPTSETHFIFGHDTPQLSNHEELWIGRANLSKKREGRFDVTGWVNLDDWEVAPPPERVAAVILLSKPLPMEYPGDIYGLFKALEKNGVSFNLLYTLLKVFAAGVPKNTPTYIILGAPMRRKKAGAPLQQHLNAWEIDAKAVNALQEITYKTETHEEAYTELAEWMVAAKTSWCRIFDNRPEVTNRRDQASLLTGIKDKSILLLGCGAIGSAIAEHLVRAGAKYLSLIDNGLVNPGILVRQKYSDCDIGLPKSKCLAQNLKKIGLPTKMVFSYENLKTGIIGHIDISQFDLIINATASNQVAHAIERDFQQACLLIPLISISVSAAAKCGSVVVKMPRFCSGIIAIDRLTKIALTKSNASHPVRKCFWPDKSEIELFQPEPGCSEPTFTGSSADLASHAATLLNVGLKRISTIEPNQASSDLLPAPWTQIYSSGPLQVILDNPSTELEKKNNYEVLTSKVAQQAISSEIRRITRTRSNKIETGGLIFGEIDESHGRVYIDSVTGPPPDSEACEEKFYCGISGTKSVNAAKLLQSGESSRFIGIWHTHPISRGSPSTDDLRAMVQLLSLQDRAPRHVIMLIVGFSATNPQPNYFLFRRKDICIVTKEELRLILERGIAA